MLGLTPSLVSAHKEVSMSLDQLFMALVLLGLLMLAGKWLRVHVALFGKLFLPSAILGGALGLLLGPQGFGALASLLSGDESRFATGLLPRPAWRSGPACRVF